MKYSKRLFITVTPVQLGFIEAEAERLACSAPEIMRKLVDGEMRRHAAHERAEREERRRAQDEDEMPDLPLKLRPAHRPPRGK